MTNSTVSSTTNGTSTVVGLAPTNFHTLVDRSYLAVEAVLGPIVFRSLHRKIQFRESLESATLEEHLVGVKFELPPFNGEGHHEMVVDTLIGPLNTAFRVLQWLGQDHPTIIFHHGAGEVPFHSTFERLIPYRQTHVRANLVAVRAPYHRSKKDSLGAVRRLENWIAMMAVSVELVEKLLGSEPLSRTAGTLVAGYSLGGFIANLHHVYYDTADAYVPMAAGALYAEVFLDSVLKGRYSEHEVRQLREGLNFAGDFASGVGEKVFPVLCQYDRLNLYERHRPCYGAGPVEVWPRGHLTGAHASALGAAHILQRLPVRAELAKIDSERQGQDAD